MICVQCGLRRPKIMPFRWENKDGSISSGAICDDCRFVVAATEPNLKKVVQAFDKLSPMEQNRFNKICVAIAMKEEVLAELPPGIDWQ